MLLLLAVLICLSSLKVESFRLQRKFANTNRLYATSKEEKEEQFRIQQEVNHLVIYL